MASGNCSTIRSRITGRVRPSTTRGGFARAASIAAPTTMRRGARRSTVLELACGTGLFTRHLAPHVAAVTAVDASPEVISINRGRVALPNVRYVQADLFAFEPG